MRTTILLCALALTGCDQLTGSAKTQPRERVGRWSIIHSPHMARDTMLLDTATGNTWQLVKLGSDEKKSGVGWQFVRKLDNPAEITEEDWEWLENSQSPPKNSN